MVGIFTSVQSRYIFLIKMKSETAQTAHPLTLDMAASGEGVAPKTRPQQASKTQVTPRLQGVSGAFRSVSRWAKAQNGKGICTNQRPGCAVCR